MEHPKLHDSATICVQEHKQFGRKDYAPCNSLANEFAEGFKQKGFTLGDLGFLRKMGYCVLVQHIGSINFIEFGDE